MTKKTHKILDIFEEGYHVICIKDLTGKTYNPYKLYHEYWEPGKGSRRRLIANYADFGSVLTAVSSLYMEGGLTK